MKNLIHIFSIVMMLVPSVSVSMGANDLLSQAGSTLRTAGEKIFVDVIEEKKQKRAELQKEKTTLEQATDKFQLDTSEQLQVLDQEITQVKTELRRNPVDDFFNKKLTILNELYQGIKDLQKAREELISILDEHIKLLSTYLEDTDFSRFKKDHKFKDYLIYYSFDDLHQLHQSILDQERRVAQLTEQINNAKTELGHRKQSAAAAAQVFKQKREELERFPKEFEPEANEQENLTLINLEERLFSIRNQLDELRLREILQKIALFETKKFIAEGQLRILKDEFRRIKPAIRVSEADVANAKQELANKRKKHLAMQDVYRQRLGVVLADKQEKSNTLEVMSKRFNVPLGADLDAWRIEPQQTVASYLGVCQVGAMNAYILLLETKRRLLDLQSTIETVISNNEAIQLQVKESFHKLNSGAFSSEDAIAQELKKYDAPRSEAKANITLYRTEIQNIDEQLEGQKKILDVIAQLRKNIQDNQSRIFKHAGKEYLTCIEMLARAERSVKERIDLLKLLNSIYGEGIDAAERTIRQINFIIAEMNAITIWYRPEYAISWEGVKNIVKDVEVFFTDVYTYLRRISFESIVEIVQDTIENPYNTLFILLKLLILVVGLFVVRLCIPPVVALLMRMHTGGIIRVLSMMLIVLLKFIHTYFVSITIWVVLLAAIMTQFVLDPYIYILFYLGSIPYLLVLSNCFIRFMSTFNKQEQYPILSQEFERRFMIVFSTLLYATIIIFLFREAFEVFRWIRDYQSELASILFAINYIIFQIGLIFLISKEQILNVLPDNNNFSHWVRDQVDRYYALLLLAVITIIVMINPYVGFGSLVWYLLKGIFLTSLLAAGLFWLYGVFKNVASRVFFAREDEIVRERFSHAKTWFGLLIITLFICVGILGIVLNAYIWGWPLGLKDVGSWLSEPLIPGVTPPITVMSILKLITFVLGGLLVSYALNRFVLDKIFDLLLVDMGVQHTVTSISRYLIVIATVFLGLQNVGLGNLVIWIVGALALGVGWILKEPISDFVGYFIILVQRPLKIGDFIQIDDNTLGVVRKITPRSIVLRRKNSTTIVVPNSYVINHAIVNWNYVRKFIAFNDILIVIDYAHDPAFVLQVLTEAVESHPKVLKNPRPIVRLDDFSEYGYKFMVRGFLSDVYTLDQWVIASDVRILIVKKLQEHGIDIAVPVRRYVSVVQPGIGEKPGIPENGRISEGKGMKE